MQENNDNTSFHDEAPSDKGMRKMIQNAREHSTQEPEKIAKGITTDDDEDTGAIYSKNLMEDVDEDLEDEIDEFED